MDEISTPITEQLVSMALKKDKYPSPSVSSLEFIKNFARNFRVQRGVDGNIGELVLN